MARKYVRDNRGRFARVGATARGGRLLTAAGNRRKTQTIEAPAAKRPGTVSAKPRSKPAKPQPQSKLRPGELMNANARPVYTMAKVKKQDVGRFQDAPANLIKGSAERKAVALDNLREQARVAQRQLRKEGLQNVKVTVAGPNHPLRRNADKQVGANNWAGFYSPGVGVMFNANVPSSAQPIKTSKTDRRKGEMSSSSPAHTALHEVGHAVHYARNPTFFISASGGPHPAARRVSKYAATNTAEFAAEVYAGLRTGRKYDYKVMQAYRAEMGLPKRPPARRRSRLPKR